MPSCLWVLIKIEMRINKYPVHTNMVNMFKSSLTDNIKNLLLIFAHTVHTP